MSHARAVEVADTMAHDAAALTVELQRMAGKEQPNGAEFEVRLVEHKHSFDVCIGQNKILKINPAHYDKLRTLYSAHRGQPSEEGLLNAVAVMLLRYHELQGHGFQAALNEHAFIVLHKRMGVTMECFASPLNCFFGHFCSAFPDTV